MTKPQRPEAGDYLAAFDEPKPSSEAVAIRRESSRDASAPDSPSPRVRMTFDLPEDLAREIRVAAVSLPPDTIGGTLSALVARLISVGLEDLRATHNEGQPFRRDGAVRVSRGPAPRV